MEVNTNGERALIAAVLNQALFDAVGKEEGNRRTARSFINEKNEVFNFYNTLLGYNPEYISMKMWIKIMKSDYKEWKDKLKNLKLKVIEIQCQQYKFKDMNFSFDIPKIKIKKSNQVKSEE